MSFKTGVARTTKLPVSANESPKLNIEVKLGESSLAWQWHERSRSKSRGGSLILLDA
jgi:hypothetical protein